MASIVGHYAFLIAVSVYAYDVGGEKAVASGVGSIAVFAGPAIAGVLLGVASTAAVFTVTASLIVVSALFLLLMTVEHVERPRRELDAGTIAAERLAGFTTLFRNPS